PPAAGPGLTSASEAARIADPAAATAPPLPEPRLVGTLTGAAGRLASLGLSRDGRIVVAGTSAGTASLWDGRTSGAVVALPAPPRLVTSLAASADGGRFVTASLYEGVLRIWDGRTGRQA